MIGGPAFCFVVCSTNVRFLCAARRLYRWAIWLRLGPAPLSVVENSSIFSTTESADRHGTNCDTEKRPVYFHLGVGCTADANGLTTNTKNLTNQYRSLD